MEAMGFITLEPWLASAGWAKKPKCNKPRCFNFGPKWKQWGLLHSSPGWPPPGGQRSQSVINPIASILDKNGSNGVYYTLAYLPTRPGQFLESSTIPAIPAKCPGRDRCPSLLEYCWNIGRGCWNAGRGRCLTQAAAALTSPAAGRGRCNFRNHRRFQRFRRNTQAAARGRCIFLESSTIPAIPAKYAGRGPRPAYSMESSTIPGKTAKYAGRGRQLS